MPLVKTNEKGPMVCRLGELQPGTLLRVHKGGDIYMHAGDATDYDKSDIKSTCVVHLRTGHRYYNPDTLKVFPLAEGVEVTLTQQ